MRAMRRKKAKEDQFYKKSKKSKKERFELNDDLDQNLSIEASKIEPYSYYKENIFQVEDFYLYRAIMNIYSSNFEQAIKDFEMSVMSKQDQKEETTDRDNQSQTSN